MRLHVCLYLWLSRWFDNGIAGGFVRDFGCRSRMVPHWSFFFRFFMDLLRSFLVLDFHCRRRALFMMDCFFFLHRLTLRCLRFLLKVNCLFLWLLDYRMDFFLWCLVSLFVMSGLLMRLFFFDFMVRLDFLFCFRFVMTFLDFFLRLLLRLFLNWLTLFLWL